ncbi:hypothetical protein LXL04_032862 [Taraxacum kok-saghyz]
MDSESPEQAPSRSHSSVQSNVRTKTDIGWDYATLVDYENICRFKIDKKAFDPINYENIDKTDFWVIQEEPEGDIDYNELENMLQEQEHEPASQSQETGSVNVDENEVDTEFQLLSDRVIDAYNTPMSEIP